MTKRIFALFLASFLLVGLASPAAAHGGGEIQVPAKAAGAYEFTVWLNPPEPEAGDTLHITVGVSEADTGLAVLDADVLVEVFRVGEDTPVHTEPATTENSVNKLFYEMDFELEEPGQYQISVALNGEGGSGDAAFTVEVTRPSFQIDWLTVGIGGLIVVMIIGVFLMNRSPAGADTEA